MDMPNGGRSLLEIDATDAIEFPTEKHKAFIDFITQQCREKSITALLKGSLVNGTAKEHSDIDIILMGENILSSFDSIVGAFDEILLSEHFTATSTYMVVYTNGLAVEYDVRRSVTEDEIRKACVLNASDYLLSEIRRDRLFVDSRLCPTRSKDYSKLMIAQMCCAKLLCQKDRLARDIFIDRLRLLNEKRTPENDLKSVADFCQVVCQNLSNDSFLNALFQAVFTSPVCVGEIREYFKRLFLEIKSK